MTRRPLTVVVESPSRLLRLAEKEQHGLRGLRGAQVGDTRTLKGANEHCRGRVLRVTVIQPCAAHNLIEIDTGLKQRIVTPQRALQ